MDIRLLGEADTTDAKALWSEAFGDSKKFIDWYFANKVLPGNSVGMFDGRLVSVLHMIPFHVCVQGRYLESAFIAGAATAKTRQGQGHMRALLLEALKLLRSRGIVMTHLYPFKHSFYEKFGWATYSYVYNKNANTQSGYPAGEVAETGDWRLLAPLYSGMMSRYDGYIVRNEREWEWRLQEHMTDGGRAALLIKKGTPAAYMLYYIIEGKAEIMETVYNEEEDLHPLLQHILKSSRSAEYFIPAISPCGAVPYGTKPLDAVSYGMARVVDAQALLKFFGAEEALGSIRISDDFAGWNNVGKGIEMKIDSLAKMVHIGAEEILNKNEYNTCNSLLEKVFQSRATCIFEQY